VDSRGAPLRRLVALAAAGALVWLAAVPGPVHAFPVLAYPVHAAYPADGRTSTRRAAFTSADWLQVVPPRRVGTMPDSVRQPLPGSVRVLQMNLCDSGLAGCYTGGRSIREAAALIRRLAGAGTAPDIVAVNEVCVRDVNALLPVLASIWPGDYTWSLFAPALDRATGPVPAPFQCLNRDAYGSGLVGHAPPADFHGVSALVGRYADQSSDREERAYACAYLAGNLYACVTHLAAEDHRIAFRQCQDLLRQVLPGFVRREGAPLATVVSGDFNLVDQPRPYTVGGCVPQGSHRTGDNSLQHVVVAGGTVEQHAIFPMRYTDHPALLATIGLSRA
jgi:hypothetical protein